MSDIATPLSPVASTLTGVDGNLSYKRAVGAIAALCLAGCLLAEICGRPVHDHLIDVFEWIVVTMALGSTIEQATKLIRGSP